jgi:hypothetical protein
LWHDRAMQSGGPMKTAKEEARRLIEGLPDNATWDDVMYELYVFQKIDAGIQAADDKRVVPHEELKKATALGEGLISLAGGWEGSDELAERVSEIRWKSRART